MIMRAPSPINFRAFLISALIVTGAVFCAYLYVAVSKSAGVAVGAVYLAATAAFVAIAAVKYKRKTIKLRLLICAAFSLIVSVSAFGFAVHYGSSREVSDGYGGYREVEGRICAFDVRDGTYKADLEDLRFDGNDVNGVLRVTFSATDNNTAESMEVGDRLSFDAYITAVEFVEGGAVNGASYRTDIRYYANVNPENVKITFGKPSAIEKFTQSLHKLLTDNMGDRYGNIAFSMFTGDKRSLGYDITDAFSAAGIGHILAVSGLHLGFTVLLIEFLLRKVNKRVRFPIIIAIIAAYVVLADFSPSVVRAAVMTVVSGLAVIVGGRRDLLSSLCLSYCVILAFKPFYLFETGFLLSFGAILGIALFSDRIARLMTRRSADGKVSRAIGTAVSVEIGVIPSIVFYFHKIQPLAFLINFVLIPYTAIVFILTVVCTAIGAIPMCGAVLLVPKYMLMPIDYIAQGIAAVPFANITVYASAAVFLCYLVMFFASGFFMMPKGKLAVVFVSLVACFAFCTPLPMSDGMLTAVNSASTDTLITDGGNVYLIGYVRDGFAVKDALIKNRCKRINAVYLLGLDHKTLDALLDIKDEFDIGTVYNDVFGEVGARLIDNGFDFKLYGETDGHAVKEVKLAGERVGYEYRDVFFAEDDADPIVFPSYTAVRVKTVDDTSDGIKYLCNYVKEPDANIKTLANGAYSYEFCG